MATLTVSASWTSRLFGVTYLLNGDYIAKFVFLDASNSVVRSHEYLLKADGSGVYDEKGAQIAATTPAALLTAASSLATNFDTALANGISGGKVTP